jgi:hypothetical protein
MLDYVRSTCDHVKDVDYTATPGSRSVQNLFPDARDIDGEYIPDPKQVAEVEEELGVRPEYGNELRYINLGPTRIRNLLATETDPRERAALEHAYKVWQASSPMAFDPDNMGWVDRGETREASHTTMQEMAAAVDPVPYDYDMGSLSISGGSSSAGREQAIGLFEEMEMNLDRSADDLYFEAGGWVPPCDGESELDMLLKYDVDEVVSY